MSQTHYSFEFRSAPPYQIGFTLILRIVYTVTFKAPSKSLNHCPTIIAHIILIQACSMMPTNKYSHLRVQNWREEKFLTLLNEEDFQDIPSLTHICIIKYSCYTNDSIQIKTNVWKIWIRHYLLIMMLHIHHHKKHQNYYCRNPAKNVSLQYILPAWSAQMSKRSKSLQL